MRVLASRVLYWLGVVFTLVAIGVVLYGARQPSLALIGLGFVVGLVAMGLTATGAAMKRY